MKNIITFVFAAIFAAGIIPSVSFADAPLAVSCSASVTYADYGDTVTWTATTSGGDGNYQGYQWSGADGYDTSDALSGSSDVTTKTYTTAGDKSGHIVVSDGLGATAQADCNPMTVLAPLTFNSCSANEVNGMTGQTITWSSNISGGLPPYTFSWSGTDGLSGSGTQATIIYNATGTKSAEIGTIVDSLSHTITGVHACTAPVTIQAQPSQMTASCSAGASTLSTGSQATWNATVSGGTAPYTVSWTGSDSLSGTGTSVNKTYSSGGTKSASITVTSTDGQTLTNISCGSINVTSPSTGGSVGGGTAIYGLTASCSATPSTAKVGDVIVWTSTVSGGTTPYTYAWTGSEGLSATTSTTSKAYLLAGTASSSVVVKSNDSQTVTANCSALITSTTGTSTPGTTGGTATTTTGGTNTTGGTTGTGIIPGANAGTGIGGNPPAGQNGNQIILTNGGTTTATSTATTTESENGLVAGVLAAAGNFIKNHPVTTSIVGLGILGLISYFWLFAKRDEEEEEKGAKK